MEATEGMKGNDLPWPSPSYPCVLQALGNCRQTLDTLCGERSQVLDLVPHPLRMILLGAGRDSWLALSRPSSPWVERNETPKPDPIGPYTPGKGKDPSGRIGRHMWEIKNAAQG